MVRVSLGLGWVRIRVRVEFVNMFGVMVIVNTSQNLNPDPYPQN